MFDKKKAAAMLRSAMHHAADRSDGLAIEFARLSRNKNQIALYVIRDPFVPDRFGHADGAVFYAGQTRKPRRRILQHLASGVRGRQSRRPKPRHVNAMPEAGVVPRFELIGIAPDRTTALELETRWISYLAAMSYPITNSAGIEARFVRCAMRRFTPEPTLDALLVTDVIAKGPGLLRQCLACGATDEPTHAPKGVTVRLWRLTRPPCSGCGCAAFLTAPADDMPVPPFCMSETIA